MLSLRYRVQRLVETHEGHSPAAVAAVPVPGRVVVIAELRMYELGSDTGMLCEIPHNGHDLLAPKMASALGVLIVYGTMKER